MWLFKFKTKENIAALVSLILITILFFIPNKFENGMYKHADKVKAEVISVDNSQIRNAGLTNYGEQGCKIKILSGKFKGMTTNAVNNLTGQLEMDKIFVVHDTAFVVVDYKNNNIVGAVMIDHYRINLEIYLTIALILALVLFAGSAGVRAVLSFIFTILMIWKVLVPCFLSGYNPIIVGMSVTIFNTIIIISLVYGFDKRSFAAILGSMSGIIVTGIMSIYFVSQFKIHGAIIPFAESLLYSGFQNINLTAIFTASIFISASGAMMDVAVDIASAIDELSKKNPNLSKKELIKSGFTIGRAIMGTMTTTLLIAYSGGYIGLLMLFMAQGTPIDNILNLKYVSSEILHTTIGSFGLVLVAPFTAIISGFLCATAKRGNSSDIDHNKTNLIEE